MKTSYLKAFTVILLSFVYLTACDAPSKSGGESQNTINSMEDLNIPANFDWKTQKDITFKLRGYQTGSVRFISQNGTEYHRANLIENGEYSFKLTVPAYMDHITVVYRGQQKDFNLNRSVIAHTFESQGS